MRGFDQGLTAWQRFEELKTLQIWGKCKRWTLDHGLDRGLDFATEETEPARYVRQTHSTTAGWFQFACVSVQNSCIPVPTSILLNPLRIVVPYASRKNGIRYL